MNPIGHLVEKEFEDLTGLELLDVVNAYIDSNNYPNLMNSTDYTDRNGNVSKEYVIDQFEDKYSSIYTLEEYFIFWTKDKFMPSELDE